MGSRYLVFVAALLATIGSAEAGQLQVTARSPVVVAIDGLPAGIAHLHADDRHRLSPGTHRVTIRNFMGALMAEGTFDIPEGERVVVEYDRTDRTLQVVERIPLTSASDATPGHDHDHDHDRDAPPPVDTRDPSSEPIREPVEAPASAGESAAVGPSSLVITGLSDISGAVRIDGQPVAFTSDADGFLSMGLDVPLVEAHITDNGVLRFHGAVALEPGRHTACHLHYRATTWTLDCEPDGEAREP
jgi:hypothetical protein